jgi:PAS domain S-box-containing protein
MNNEFDNYKKFVKSNLEIINKNLPKYALGNFSSTIPVNHEENEFTEIQVGLNLMVDDIREMIINKEKMIDRLKKVEQELLTKDYMIKSASSAIATADLNGKMIYANPKFHEWWNFKHSNEFIGRNFTEFWMVDDQINEIMSTLEKEGMWAGELKAKRKDGSTFYVQVSAAMVRDYDNKPICLMSSSVDISERKQMEEKLKSEKYISDSVINSLPGIFYMFDQKGKFYKWNTGLENITGYSSKEIADLSPLDFFTGQTKKKISKKILQVFTKGKAEVEGELVTKNGKHLPHYLTGHLRKINKKKYLLGVGLDISERLKIEKELNASKEKYEKMLMNLMEGFYSSTIEGILLEHNTEFCKILGLDASKDYRGMELPNLWQNANDREEYIKALTENGHVNNFIANAKKANGEKIFAELNCQLIKDDDGKPTRIEGTFLDVTDKIFAEKELAKSESEKQKILSSIDSGVYIYDVKEKCNVYINSAYTIKLGYTLDEINQMGKGFLELFHPEDLHKVVEHINDLINDKKGKSYYLLYRFKTKEGKWMWCESLDTPYSRDKDGSTVQFIGSFNDVTNRIEAENNLQKSLVELKQSNDDLQQFAYVASHDLQEPLRMVTNYLQLIERRYAEKLDDTGIEFMDFAVDGANRMKRLIEDLLSFSRISTHGDEFKESSLNRILNESLQNLDNVIEERDVLITKDRLPKLKVDSSQIVRLFQNLIENGIKYNSSDEPEIKIKAEELNDHWQFSVIDNGIGIAEKYYKRIFVIFQRLHGKNEYKGSGMGLALCKKIVERHRGEIWLESDVNKCSQFYFTLPKN